MRRLSQTDKRREMGAGKMREEEVAGWGMGGEVVKVAVCVAYIFYFPRA